ncbi:hypothetical protein WA158_007879 [Blastocystis sp. Blastoise]
MLLTSEKAEELKAKFVAQLDPIIDVVCEDVKERGNFPFIVERHIREMLHYNLEGGKMIRGLSTVYTGYTLCPEWCEDYEKKFILLGWCIEFMQALFLIADDIMDGGQMRRNKLCWYKVEHIGLMSITDILLLESQIPILIKRTFSSSPSPLVSNQYNDLEADSVLNNIQKAKDQELKEYQYTIDHSKELFLVNRLLEILNEVQYITGIGEYIDTYISLEKQFHKKDSQDNQYDVYSLKNYLDIIINKTSYYTIYIPIALAYTFVTYLYPPTSSSYIYININITKELCKYIGELFQIQDDYLDFYADPKKLGKVGTDVEEGKCSWMYVTLLSVCNKEDEELCRHIYADKTIDYANIIKELYIKYDLQKIYKQYEQNKVQEIQSSLEKYHSIIPYDILSYLLQKINKRNY